MPLATKKCSGTCKQTKSRLEFYNDRSQADGKSRRCIACVKAARNKSTSPIAGEAGLQISDEERQRRSELATRLHAEGKLGGSENGKKGGRPRAKSITEAVIEEFRDDVEPVISALKVGLRSESDSTRVRAVQVLTNLEQQMEDRLLKARGGGKPLEEMSREELQATILEGVRRLQEQGRLDQGDAVDVEHEELGDPEPAAAA